MSVSPVTAYFWDNGEATIYNLTLSQIDMLNELDDGTLEKFEVDTGIISAGYCPDWLIWLSENGEPFEVGSI